MNDGKFETEICSLWPPRATFPWKYDPPFQNWQIWRATLIPVDDGA